MPKFTFRVPTHNHDEVEIVADDANHARDILYEYMTWDGSDHAGRVTVVETDIDDYSRYWKEEAFDCLVFDEEGEPIT